MPLPSGIILIADHDGHLLPFISIPAPEGRAGSRRAHSLPGPAAIQSFDNLAAQLSNSADPAASVRSFHAAGAIR